MKLRLLNSDFSEITELEVDAGTRLINPLRQLAQSGALAFVWKCGNGSCGRCLVHLEHAGSGRMLTLSHAEHCALQRRESLSQLSPATLPDTPDLPRLACHVVIEHDLIVHLPPPS